MRRIFRTFFNLPSTNLIKYSLSKNKPELQSQNSIPKHSLFHQKTFSQIINIIKNPQNPYPKNATYYYAILQYILQESNQNAKIMVDYGDAIHVFLQDVMERIKTMPSKELSQILTLLRFRPKALRFDKQTLITMHVRFQARIKQLIILNQQKATSSEEQLLTMEDIKNQIDGLFYLKKNTTILNKVLVYSYDRIIQLKKNSANKQLLQTEANTFYKIIQIINDNLDDTIDPVRQGIAEFLQLNYNRQTLEYNKQILRMITKCKYYKNYPIVRCQDWLHEYVYKYLQKIVRQNKQLDIQQIVNVLKSSILYAMHIDAASRQKFMDILQQAYQISDKNLQSINYLINQQQLTKQLNTISQQIKLIPSYLYLKHYYNINTVQNTFNQNKVDSNYIKLLIKSIKPIIKKFILCYLQVTEIVQKDVVNYKFVKSIEQNIEIINESIKVQPNPEKTLLKSVQNLLNTVTVFKDYNIIQIDPQFSITLIQTQFIYCILCRKWIADQVRYLRLIEHSVFILCQFQKQMAQGNQNILKYKQQIQLAKQKLQQELNLYDNMDKSYKQFTVLRLVSLLRSMKMQPQFLGDFYRNIKFKRPNIYVQTLSRTMLKSYNYTEVINAFQLMFQGKIPVKQIQLGRIVFLSSKQLKLLKYWIDQNRQQFITKICFNRRIMNNIVSIIRMDNLEINRNSIQLLAEIVTQNKLFQIQNYSISNHLQSNALKKILCNNFSILFRYSKMDSMIQDVFIVNKNIPTTFRKKFNHIENIKILTFSSYLSEEQSIFYVNRQNKNALFKYVIMLMRTQPYCQRRKAHYLLGASYSDQSVTVNVVDKIIQQYWPDNKLTNKGMPFYAQFLNYYTKVNKFGKLVENQNPIFLIIREILSDYKQIKQNGNKTSKHIVSRQNYSYQKFHILTLFENESNVTNTLQNVLSSMNFVMQLKIFGQFSAYYQKCIREEIGHYKKAGPQERKLLNDCKQWNPYKPNKHLVNLMIISNKINFDEFSEIQILNLLTADVLVHGMRDKINQNMQQVIRRITKINPTAIKYQVGNQNKKKYPFELFKIALSNLNIYLQKRDSRIQIGKQIVYDDIKNDKIIDWIIKCLLTYAKQIKNNQQLLHITKYLNDWNVDVLALISSRFLNINQNLSNLANAYFDVEFLCFLFSQNLINYNSSKLPVEVGQFSNENIVKYINVVIAQIQQTHLINSYGIYFYNEGQKILNVMKSLLFMILSKQKNHSTSLYKQANQTFKKVKELFQTFNKITNKTLKYNKLQHGGKYSYLYNENQGQTVDMFSNSNIRKQKNPYSQQTPDSLSVSLKIFSKFSQILQIIYMVQLNKWSASHFNAEHTQQIKKINAQISKKQKGLFLSSQLTYYTTTEPILELKQFQQFGLNLYVKNHQNQNSNKMVVYYIVDQKESMLYDFSYKKRKRIIGEEQITIDYLQTLISISKTKESQNANQTVQIRVIPNHLSKVELKKLLSS